jgi:alkylhydroperoxidase family enzyme
MSERPEALAARLRSTVLTAPGTTDSALRRAVEQRAAEAGGRADGEREEVGRIPSELSDYVSKVIHHAHRVTDEDVERLKQAGYSEDAIFEVTVAAALGAGMGRLERGLAALRGGG